MSRESARDKRLREALQLAGELERQRLAPDISALEFWTTAELLGWHSTPMLPVNLLTLLGAQFDEVVRRVRVEKAKDKVQGRLDTMWDLPAKGPGG